MKKITLYLSILLLFPLSCRDEDLAPIAIPEKLEKGAFPRILSETVREYNIRDLANAKYEYTVDFKDVSGGKEIARYEIFVRFQDNTGGTSSKAEKLWKTFTPENFSPQAKGNLGLTVVVPFNEIASLLGLTAADVEYGDRFQFRTVVTTKDGRTFSSANTTPDIPGALGGFFDFSILMTCPLGNLYTGSYRVTYKTPPTSALGAPFGANPGNVTLTASTSSVRTLTLKHLGTTNTTVTLTFACNEIRVGTITTARTCGQGRITIAQGAKTPFSFTSDATFEVELIDYATNGGCRDAKGDLLQPTPFTLVFTKN
ncbi:MAG: hypothetical protein NZM43_13010 [Saprospiraceae bacterium]|nr:hypothetical protein [Saprospiraceae bacterium]MDW8485233.1 hypothetical protein [Saprospiraceae bacterium]